jgi:superoxide reductase
MNRREFIKGAALATAFLSTGSSLAYNGSEGAPGEGLLELKNRENPTPMERGHVPAIETVPRVRKNEWFDVNVRVGFMKEHPSHAEHWIIFIKLMVDGTYVTKTEFEVGGISSSSALFRIRIAETGLLYAVAHCNLHGTWLSDAVTVKV